VHRVAQQHRLPQFLLNELFCLRHHYRQLIIACQHAMFPRQRTTPYRSVVFYAKSASRAMSWTTGAWEDRPEEAAINGGARCVDTLGIRQIGMPPTAAWETAIISTQRSRW
jgi:hypothetical protein